LFIQGRARRRISRNLAKTGVFCGMGRQAELKGGGGRIARDPAPEISISHDKS
jgi:hypothetical protein